MSIRIRRSAAVAALVVAITCAMPVWAQDSAADLAQQLANPVAALISVPIQLNYDQDIGPEDDGDRWMINLQPVVPITLNEDWNLISRTILPIISQSDVYPGAGSQTGIGDLAQSVFFSPKDPTSSGWIWGVGAILMLPTGSDDLLTSDKWSAGPTAVVLRQQGPWTYGALVNQAWSFAGSDDRADVNSTFLQPFVSYATPTAWSATLSTESSYDWEGEQWSVPLNVIVAKVTKVGGQLVSVGGGVRYWADGPDSGPEGFGFRLIVTLLFPK